jgi:osmotically inducible protein OsmC
MTVRSTASAEWKGTLKEGAGQMRLGGANLGEYTWASRFETGKGTNPEELVAAALAGCFSMNLSGVLTSRGKPPTAIRSKAHVTIVPGVGINKLEIETEADVPNIDNAAFQDAARHAKDTCPVAMALASVKDVSLRAKLV